MQFVGDCGISGVEEMDVEAELQKGVAKVCADVKKIRELRKNGVAGNWRQLTAGEAIVCS